MISTGACEAFVSAPIKLAARISERSRGGDRSPSTQVLTSGGAQPTKSPEEAHLKRNRSARISGLKFGLLLALACCGNHARGHLQHVSNSQLINQDGHGGRAQHESADQRQSSLLRHHAHYLNFVPSAHFSYQEGRQAGGRSLLDLGEEASPLARQDHASQGASHIYKRSSAVLLGGRNSPPVPAGPLNPLSKRMMAHGNSRLPVPAAGEPMQASGSALSPVRRQPNWLGVGGAGQEADVQARELFVDTAEDGRPAVEHHASQQQVEQHQQQQQPAAGHQLNKRQRAEQEAELLRQKQHIQYHDQWPSMAGKCHKRTLNFCASVLPFNTTTFPNIIGDTTRFEVKRSLPFFGFLAKSSCNKRLDELLCLLLEPPCSSQSGTAIPPCKKFCRVALEGCNEYIPATLALSSVFDCRQYPDSNDPNVCINLAQGDKCAQDEFKCPDETCIPRNWVCDGVRDCIFASDEANCTDSSAVPQASVCSTEEFKCDGKCVPKAWKCDGERDCLDGSDEESCDLRPRCGSDRFKCADGNGCIPKRWVCDGKAECRDGSDEMHCDQRECSENDFKCGNGICIPKLWRCDRQFDCKDGSDEHQCVYPTPSTTTTTTSTSAPTTEAALTTITQPSASEALQMNASSSYGIEAQTADEKSHEAASKQLEMDLMSDISRFIQNDRESVQQQQAATTGSTQASIMVSPEAADQRVTQAPGTRQAESAPEGSQQQQQVGELKKFNYDLIASPAANMVQVGNEPAPVNQASGEPQLAHGRLSKPAMLNQVEFVAQQAKQPAAGQRVPAQRLPIYRSLFKSFKSNQQPDGRQAHLGGQQQGGAGPHRNVVAIARRRRERHHQQPADGNSNQQVALNLRAFPAAGDHQQLGPVQQAAAIQMHQPNQTLVRPAHGEVGGSVASYLQLLNGRYNLRLPRMGPAAPLVQ